MQSVSQELDSVAREPRGLGRREVVLHRCPKCRLSKGLTAQKKFSQPLLRGRGSHWCLLIFTFCSAALLQSDWWLSRRIIEESYSTQCT